MFWIWQGFRLILCFKQFALTKASLLLNPNDHYVTTSLHHTEAKETPRIKNKPLDIDNFLGFN